MLDLDILSHFLFHLSAYSVSTVVAALFIAAWVKSMFDDPEYRQGMLEYEIWKSQ